MESRLVKERLKKMRTSESELAREMGVHLSTISRFLSGKSKPKKPFLMTLGWALENIEAKVRADLDALPISHKKAV